MPAAIISSKASEPDDIPCWVQAARHDSLWIREVIVESGQSTRQDIHLHTAWVIPTGT